MMKTIKVTATQFDNQWAVECSVCNYMALVAAAAVDDVSRTHLHAHSEGK